MTHEEWEAAFAKATGEEYNQAVESQTVPVIKLKPIKNKATRGAKLAASYKRDKLEKAEYENQFPAVRTKHSTYVTRLAESGASVDALAVAMVAEYLDLKNYGQMRVLPTVVLESLEIEGSALSKFIGPLTDAVQIRYGVERNGRATDDSVAKLLRPNSFASAEQESNSWKINRTPQQGIRPRVLIPRAASK